MTRRQGSEILTVVFLALAVISPVAFADEPPPESTSTTQEADAQSPRRIYWDDGLRFRLFPKTPGPEEGLTAPPEGAPYWITGKVNFRLMVDSADYFTSNGLETIDSGTQVRRFMLGVGGEIHGIGNPLYAVNFELAGTNPQWADTFLFWQGLPWIGSLKVGNFDPPFSLEALISSRDTTFMEDASPVAAFAPGRKFGAQIGEPVWDESVTWYLGFFTAVQPQDVGDTTRDVARIAARVTWLVSHDVAARRWVHLGLGVTALASNDNLRYRSRPESHLAPFLVDTGTVHAGAAEIIGLEAAWVEGPFSLQSEIFHSFVDQPGETTLNFGGAYIQASWFLTGECRPYNTTRGIFGPVTPLRNFSLRGPGWGAFEFGTRLSYLDLTSEAVRGGVIHGVTGDLTWYLNRHWKTKFEYGFEAIRSGASNGNLQFLQVRFQVDY
jgi:phosphate-selective porin OprO and OprP